MKTFNVYFTNGSEITIGRCKDEQDARYTCSIHLLYSKYTIERIEEVELA